MKRGDRACLITTIFFPFIDSQLAEKELHKINAFKAPGEKLRCVVNCCKVINNLLLNASMSENLVLAGADDFLPLLIFVTIKASSPLCHSANHSFNCILFSSIILVVAYYN